MSVIDGSKVPIGQAMNFRCPVAGCAEKKKELWHLVCAKHWAKVPKALADQVWKLFKESNGSLDHRMTCAAVIADLEVKEGRRSAR